MVRFYADSMLGSLARWLRFVGCDTAYTPGASRQEMLHRARAEHRILLTKNRRLAAEGEQDIRRLVQADNYLAQLQEIVLAYDVSLRAAVFSRCTKCNAPVEQVAKETIHERVPDYVFQQHETFYMCPRCGHVYWWGTHCSNISDTIDFVATHWIM